MPDPTTPAEYVVSRKVLLDCLELLADHKNALVLVGAQAIYLQTPQFDSGLPTFTTDGDLAIDPDLLSNDPDLGALLVGARFTAHSNPGTWFSPERVAIDLMVPSGALPPSSRRTAVLDGHAGSTARRTTGLELALADNRMITVGALDPSDLRAVDVKVAGPAALLVAKLVKLDERLELGRPDRILSKDASDVLRILRQLDAAAIGTSLRGFIEADISSDVIHRALRFLALQLDGPASALIDLAADAHAQLESRQQIARAFVVLGGRVLASAP